MIPALIRKFLEARHQGFDEVIVWGTGAASREFLYVDDAARGIVLAAEHYEKADPINLGSSQELTIRELVDIIATMTGYQGRITWDHTKPDGQPRRKLNVDRARHEFGFESAVDFEDGLEKTIKSYESEVMAATRAGEIADTSA